MPEAPNPVPAYHASCLLSTHLRGPHRRSLQLATFMNVGQDQANMESEIASFGAKKSTVSFASHWRELGVHEKEAFQDKLTLAMLLAFGAPTVLSVLISYDISAAYWIGRFGGTIAIFNVIWVIGWNTLVAKEMFLRRTPVVLMMLVPGLLFLASSQYHQQQAKRLAYIFQLSDCTFVEKANLEVAWQEASKIYMECVEIHMNITGSPRFDVERITQVQRCPGYAKGMQDWGPQWQYLQSLETQEQCSGWCSRNGPLWSKFDSKLDGALKHDTCSIAAGDILGTKIRTMSFQMLVYSMAVVLMLGVVLGYARDCWVRW